MDVSPTRFWQRKDRRARPNGGASDWGTPNTAAVSIPSELAFDAISHDIDGHNVLSNVSLTAKSGTVTCLLGPSGSGKTTLLRIAAGMLRPSAGAVLLDSREIGGPNRHVPPEKRGIGLVFQDYALFPHLSILQNVTFGLAHLKSGDRAPNALQLLSRVGLDDRAHDYPHHLSGGEQQRVALARAMAPRPGVLLMDEPFSGLDSRLRDAVREETLGILRETRATSIIVTHDPEEALRMGDQIALLNGGRLEQVGTGQELYFNPASLFAAEFFSPLNLLDGTVARQTVDTPLGAIPATGRREGEHVTVAIRTNALDVSEVFEGQGAPGRILAHRFTGDHDQLTIGIQELDEPLYARVQAGALSAAALTGKSQVRVQSVSGGTFLFDAK